MSIRRGPKPDRFVILPNELAREQNLSFRARGLLAYLLSMPEDWRTNSNQLAGQSPKEGRDAIRSALTELEHAGYLKRRRIQDADGRWRTETIVTDSPVDEAGENWSSYPLPEPDEPAPANPALIEVPTTKDLRLVVVQILTRGTRSVTRATVRDGTRTRSNAARVTSTS
jgi:hypothetical protein